MESIKERMYLSLPITGRNIEKVKAYAKKIKEEWVKKGFDVVTPFEIVTDDNATYEYCMGKDITVLLKCDGIILCYDWFTSKGCRLECYAAQVYEKKIKIDSTLYEKDKI